MVQDMDVQPPTLGAADSDTMVLPDRITNPFVAMILAEERAKKEDSCDAKPPTSVSPLPGSPSTVGPDDEDLVDLRSPAFEADFGELLRREPVCYTIAVFDYIAANDDELTLRQNENVMVLSKDEEETGDIGWWLGRIDGVGLPRVGVFPQNYVIEVGQNNARDTAQMPKTSLLFDIPQDQVVQLKPIGVGGFGKVYLGYYKGGAVALKQMICCGVSERDIESKCAELRSEAELLAGFAHRNITRLLGVITTMPSVTLVLEYAAGGALSAALRNNFLDLPVTMDWSLQIAKGLSYLHNDSPTIVVHRDLKSHNVLLAKANADGSPTLTSNVLKITDFGLARKFIRTTHESGTQGTYQWMAPETITSGTYSKASDSWSFGVVVWEVLTSQVPYSGLPWETVAYMVGVSGSSLPTPSDCPKPFDALFERCWDKDPNARPTSADAVILLQEATSAISRADADNGLHSRPGSWSDLQRVWKDEMAERFNALRQSEQEMQVQEKELRDMKQKATVRQQELHEWERSLRDRERDLQFRELKLSLAPGEQALTRRPSPINRRTRLFTGGGKISKSAISSPTNFRHVVHLANDGGANLTNPKGIASPVLAGSVPVQRDDTHRSMSESSHLSPAPLRSDGCNFGGAVICKRCQNDFPATPIELAALPTALVGLVCARCGDTAKASNRARRISPRTKSGPNVPLAMGPLFHRNSLSGPNSPLSPTSPGSPESRNLNGGLPKNSGKRTQRLQKSQSCVLELAGNAWTATNPDSLPLRRLGSSIGISVSRSAAKDARSRPRSSDPVIAINQDDDPLSSSLPLSLSYVEPEMKGNSFGMSIKRLFRKSLHGSSEGENAGGGASPDHVYESWYLDPLVNWFYPNMSREDTRTFLRGRPPGAFVVRPSKSQHNALAISVVQENSTMWNGLIIPSSQGWHLGVSPSSKTFPSPPMLVEYYTKYPYSENRLLIKHPAFDGSGGATKRPHKIRDDTRYHTRRRSLSAGELSLFSEAQHYSASMAASDV